MLPWTRSTPRHKSLPPKGQGSIRKKKEEKRKLKRTYCINHQNSHIQKIKKKMNRKIKPKVLPNLTA